MDIVGGQAATNGVTNRLSCCGESVFQMLAQNKTILSWCGDSGLNSARAIVGAGAGVISLLQTVDSPDVNFICSCNDLRSLSYS